MPVIDMGDGGYAIICGPRSRKKYCDWCRGESHFLCDYEIDKGRTCDAKMCHVHATRVSAGKDYCPNHVATGGQKAMAKAA